MRFRLHHEVGVSGADLRKWTAPVSVDPTTLPKLGAHRSERSARQRLTMVDILDRLTSVRPSSNGWMAKCPAHEDRQNSLSVHHREGKWLLKCHAGCAWEAIVAALGI